MNIEYELGQTNNFVPFRSIFGYIKDFFSGYQSVFLFQCIGNILLFVPYGFFTAILSWKQKHKKKTVFIICFLTSLSIEILQVLLSLFGVVAEFRLVALQQPLLLLSVVS